MRIALLTAILAIAIALAACGDEPDKGVSVVPAAGELTPPDTTPGVPPGSTYDVTGNEWLKLADEERFFAAQDYVADNPDECSNGDGRSASADAVRDYTDSDIGTDFPLNVPIAELLAEGCAAALQSGDQGLAPVG